MPEAAEAATVMLIVDAIAEQPYFKLAAN